MSGANHIPNFRGHARTSSFDHGEKPETTETELLLAELLADLPGEWQHQYPIGAFRVDSCEPSLRIVVEADADHHFTWGGILSDIRRDLNMNSLGWVFLRFENDQIVRDPESVRTAIECLVAQRSAAVSYRPQRLDIEFYVRRVRESIGKGKCRSAALGKMLEMLEKDLASRWEWPLLDHVGLEELVNALRSLHRSFAADGPA